MFSLIQILIVGLVAGWLARRFMGTRKQGLLVDIGLGVVGAFAGTILFGALGFGAHGLIAKIIVAFVGAVVIVAAYRALTRR
jgi:uncharacterized membrane protein YeaQ/YmgE (transglycosylase-associated protein family)